MREHVVSIAKILKVIAYKQASSKVCEQIVPNFVKTIK